MRASPDQSGAALITVLILLALVAVITGAAVALSQYLGVAAGAAVTNMRGYYDAESAMNRALLLLRRDVVDHPDRTTGNYDYDGLTADMRWMADGVAREVTVGEKNCRVEIGDAAAMPALDGADPVLTLREWQLSRWTRDRSAVSAVEEQRFLAMLDKLGDYLDSDSSRGLDGMEDRDYRKAGLAALPRNGAMQFREELLWIDGAREYFPPSDGRLRDFAVIAPEGLPKLETRLSFLWSPPELVTRAAELSEAEEESFEEARRRWFEEGEFPRDYLPEALFAKITAQARLDESGFYTVTVDTRQEDAPGPRLTATLRLAGDRHFLEFYEYFFF